MCANARHRQNQIASEIILNNRIERLLVRWDLGGTPDDGPRIPMLLT